MLDRPVRSSLSPREGVCRRGRSNKRRRCGETRRRHRRRRCSSRAPGRSERLVHSLQGSERASRAASQPAQRPALAFAAAPEPRGTIMSTDSAGRPQLPSVDRSAYEQHPSTHMAGEGWRCASPLPFGCQVGRRRRGDARPAAAQPPTGVPCVRVTCTDSLSSTCAAARTRWGCLSLRPPQVSSSSLTHLPRDADPDHLGLPQAAGGHDDRPLC